MISPLPPYNAVDVAVVRLFLQAPLSTVNAAARVRMEKSYNALKNSSAGAVPMFLVSTADELREDTAAEATPDQTIDTAAATAGTAGTAGTGGKNKKKKKQSTVSATAFLQTLFFVIMCNLFVFIFVPLFLPCLNNLYIKTNCVLFTFSGHYELFLVVAQFHGHGQTFVVGIDQNHCTGEECVGGHCGKHGDRSVLAFHLLVPPRYHSFLVHVSCTLCGTFGNALVLLLF